MHWARLYQISALLFGLVSWRSTRRAIIANFV